MRGGAGHRGVVEPVANFVDSCGIVILKTCGVARKNVDGAGDSCPLQRCAVAAACTGRHGQRVRWTRERARVRPRNE